MDEISERRDEDEDRPGASGQQEDGGDLDDLEPEEAQGSGVKGGPGGTPWNQ
jgi:hypothetical protein